MGKTMKKYVKLLVNGKYNDLFILLKNDKFVYSLDNISIIFPEKYNINVFCYLLYVLSIHHELDFYILICDFLMFKNVWTSDTFGLIRWFLDVALKEYPNNGKIAEWIISVFEMNPDSPYTNDELTLIKEWSSNSG